MDDELNDSLNDEVIFWMHMIEDWGNNRTEPVPERMYEAMELARSKLVLLETQIIDGQYQIH